MKKITIHTDKILLGQALKYVGIVTNGGEIKMFLAENNVFVNENIEKRRGKQLFPGDVIEVLGEKYIIECENNTNHRNYNDKKDEN